MFLFFFLLSSSPHSLISPNDDDTRTNTKHLPYLTLCHLYSLAVISPFDHFFFRLTGILW